MSSLDAQVRILPLGYARAIGKDQEFKLDTQTRPPTKNTEVEP